MPRYQATMFGKPLGPWRGSRELADRDSIDAGEASRDPVTGQVYSGVGVKIIEAAGHEPIDDDARRWTEALKLIRWHGGQAPAHVAERIAVAKTAGKLDEVIRWRALGRAISGIIENAHRRPRTRR